MNKTDKKIVNAVVEGISQWFSFNRKNKWFDKDAVTAALRMVDAMTDGLSDNLGRGRSRWIGGSSCGTVSGGSIGSAWEEEIVLHLVRRWIRFETHLQEIQEIPLTCSPEARRSTVDDLRHDRAPKSAIFELCRQWGFEEVFIERAGRTGTRLVWADLVSIVEIEDSQKEG